MKEIQWYTSVMQGSEMRKKYHSLSRVRKRRKNFIRSINIKYHSFSIFHTKSKVKRQITIREFIKLDLVVEKDSVYY